MCGWQLEATHEFERVPFISALLGYWLTLALNAGAIGRGLSVVQPGFVLGSGVALIADGLYTPVSTRADGSTMFSPHHLGIQKCGMIDALSA